jgi:hypothetical protein
MPRKKHLRGVGEKGQRKYEHIKEEAEKKGRYRRREKQGRRAHGDEAAQREGHSKGR